MDVYYHPENYGLTTVGEVSWSNESYQFDLTGVWTKDSQLYWASDSGCSCPTPFENFHRMDDLLTGTFSDLQDYLKDRLAAEQASVYSNLPPNAEANVVDLLLKAKEVTRGGEHHG